METSDPSSEPTGELTPADVSAIIAMAWQDDIPFEALALQFGLQEAQVIALMREHLKTRSFRVWRMRVRGRAAKHQALQQARTLATPKKAEHAYAQLNSDGQPLQADSEPLDLPLSGVTAASLR
jgi:uncharacterized protein (TIGR03643 family)